MFWVCGKKGEILEDTVAWSAPAVTVIIFQICKSYSCGGDFLRYLTAILHLKDGLIHLASW